MNRPKQMAENSDSKIFYEKLEPIEPMLGPAWTFVLFLVYGIFQFFPVIKYSLFWWIEVYIIALLSIITAFAIYKRYRYRQDLRRKKM